MAIVLSDNVQTNAPKPSDSRYLNNLVPYSSTTEATTTIVEGVRYSGLTVNVGGVEYWWKDGIGDGDLVLKTTGGGSATSGENVTKEISQASHGFAVKDFVGWSGGTYNKAIADGLYDGEFVGLVTEVPDSGTFKVTQSGYVTGLTGLVTNTTYFLSESTAGLITDTAPTGDTQISKAVLIANSTTTGWVLPYAGVVISSGSSGGGDLSWDGTTADALGSYVDEFTICAQPTLTLTNSGQDLNLTKEIDDDMEFRVRNTDVDGESARGTVIAQVNSGADLGMFTYSSGHTDSIWGLPTSGTSLLWAGTTTEQLLIGTHKTDSPVKIFHGGEQRIATRTTGIEISGSSVVCGNMTLESIADPQLRFCRDSDDSSGLMALGLISYDKDTCGMEFRVNDEPTPRFFIGDSGQTEIKSCNALYSVHPSLRVYDQNNRGTFLLESLADNPTDLFMKVGGNLTWTMSARNAASDHALDFYGSQNGTSWAGPFLKLTTGGTVCASTCFKAPAITLTTGAASGCVLTSDGSGNATWQTPSGGGGVAVSGTTDNALTTYINASGDLCADPNLTFDGTTLNLRAATTETSTLQLGFGRAGNGNSIIDLIGDATYSDFGVRLIRCNAGANALSVMCHHGTGDFVITTAEAADMHLRTANSNAIVMDSSQNVCVPNGNIIAGSTTKTSNTSIIALAADAYQAGFCAYGSNQGTGFYYAGQDTQYGGGIFYNGDGNPPFASGETANDRISFYKRTGGVNCVLFSALHNCTTVDFTGDISFLQGAERTICVAEATDGGNGDNLTIDAGKGDSDTTPGTGGRLSLRGGDGGANTSTGSGGAGEYVFVRGGTGGDGGSGTGGVGGRAIIRGGLGGSASGGGAGGDTQICGGAGGIGGSTGNGGNVTICSGAGSTDGCVEIYHDTTKRFNTTTAGVCVTGALNVSSSGTFGGPIATTTTTVQAIRIACGTYYSAYDSAGNINRMMGMNGSANYGLIGSVENTTASICWYLGGGYKHEFCANGEVDLGGNVTVTGNILMPAGTTRCIRVDSSTTPAGLVIGAGESTDSSTGGNLILCAGANSEFGNGGSLFLCSGNAAIATDGIVCMIHGTSARMRTCTYGTYFYSCLCVATCGISPDWVATSDCRMKKNIIPISNALSTIDCLCGVCYDFCEDDAPDMGLIAQDVIKIEPRLVSKTNPTEEDTEKYGIEDEILNLKYDKFAGLFVEAIKELRAENKYLKAELDELKTKLNK